MKNKTNSKNKMNKTYTVNAIWFDSDGGTVSHIKSNLNIENAKEAVIEFLDIVLKNGVPVKPTLKNIRNGFNILRGQTDDFEVLVKNEYERQKNAYKAWTVLEKCFITGKAGCTMCDNSMCVIISPID